MSSPASSSSSSASKPTLLGLHGGNADNECREYTLEVPLLSPTTGIDTLLHDAVSAQAVTTRLQTFGALLGVPLRDFRGLLAVIIGEQKTGKSTLLGLLFDVPAKSGHRSNIATTLGANAFIRQVSERAQHSTKPRAWQGDEEERTKETKFTRDEYAAHCCV
jgi:hypothetical protein